MAVPARNCGECNVWQCRLEIVENAMCGSPSYKLRNAMCGSPGYKLRIVPLHASLCSLHYSAGLHVASIKGGHLQVHTVCAEQCIKLGIYVLQIHMMERVVQWCRRQSTVIHG